MVEPRSHVGQSKRCVRGAHLWPNVRWTGWTRVVEQLLLTFFLEGVTLPSVCLSVTPSTGPTEHSVGPSAAKERAAGQLAIRGKRGAARHENARITEPPCTRGTAEARRTACAVALCSTTRPSERAGEPHSSEWCQTAARSQPRECATRHAVSGVTTAIRASPIKGARSPQPGLALGRHSSRP